MESFRDTFAGALGGVSCAVVGQPLDTVKVKQQTYPHVYGYAFQTLARTYRTEGGIRALYSGCGAAIAANVAENAVLFLCYERCRDFVRWVCGVRSNEEMNLTQQASAGALASVFSCVAINPLERVKCKLQVQQQQQRSSGGRLLSGWNMVRLIVQEEGLHGIFRGLTSTWARDVPGYFFFFGGYNAGLKLLSLPDDYHNHLSVWRMAVAGGLAGCCFWTSVFPVDVVKSRVQVDGGISGSLRIITCEIIRKEGVLALYRGIMPTLVRSFPANGALFVTYEYTRNLLMLWTPSMADG